MTPFRLAMAALALALAPAAAQTLSDAFDASSDLSAFNQANSSNTAKTTANGLAQAAGIGTGGTGGVQFGAGSTGQTDLAAVSTTAFSFAGGGGYAFSMDFHKLSNQTNGALAFQMGFSSSASSALGWTGTDLLSFRVIASGTSMAQLSIGSRVVADAATTYTNIGSTFAFSASNTDWYHLTVSLTLTNPATSLFSYTVSVYDTGSDGTGSLGTALQTVTGTYTNAGIATDANDYFGFRYLSGTTTAVDNLSVAPVPEPRSAALFLGGLAAAAIGGRAWRRGKAA